MKICAVICELNPFHNGHEYIFRQARAQSGCDAVLALMSGNFVQRAEPAVTDEYARAECALVCGADVVIELPAIYAVASAEMFARGAIGILNTINSVTHLAMGAESENFGLLRALAEIQANESEEFKATLRKTLDSGLSYPKALTAATAQEAGSLGFDKTEAADALNKPNNILAVAYKKALIKTASKIEFLPVRRAGGDISEEFSGRFTSASALRKRLGDDIISQAIPSSAYSILRCSLADGSVSKERLDALMLSALRLANPSKIKDTPDCAEGMEFKISEIATRSASYEEFLSSICTARFTKGRIARICTQTLLGITKNMQNCGYDFARLLGIRKDKRELLGLLPQNIITNKQSERLIPADMLACFAADQRASAIYSILTCRRGNGFYRKLLTV